MEILAPAGNKASLLAAVRSGADAVYLGLKDFSARRNAENFNEEELREAIEYCHIRDVKVYVAVNIMIKEKELPAAIKAVAAAYRCGADAFIVSDLGLISVLRKLLPQAVLHASTQMTVHSPAALEALKKYGIKRVVLAREMSCDEIRKFCIAAKNANIEVEAFVHGALCMCVSGQCLLSSVLGGRSGNRGLCAGPCRLEFSAKGSGRYDLSLKDLSLIDYLFELENLGVTSAKIEGRMKRPEYVAAATAACRAALDGKYNTALQKATGDIFSRSGFTDGYYKGRLGAAMFGVRTKEDALSSKAAFSYIHTLYRSERQNIPLTITAKIKAGEHITLTLADSLNKSVTVSGEIPEPAKTKITDSNDIEAALSKLGSTPYFAEKITVLLDENLFVSAAALNSLRRRATDALNRLRAENNRAAEIDYTPKPAAKKEAARIPKIYAKFLSTNQMPCDFSGIDAVILPLECDFNSIPEGTLRVADIPRYILDEKQVEERLLELKNQGVTAAYCGNLSAIILTKRAGLKVIASNGLNCANSENISALASLGADEVILSAEINISDTDYLRAEIPTGIFAYGRLPIMLTRNCPIKNARTCRECTGKGVLKDRKGVLFPVTCRKHYSEVLNSMPIYLADKFGDIGSFDFLLLNFTDENANDARKIIDKYLSGGGPEKEFTRGMYYKNLL